jgi:hypothetical protein
MIEPLSLESGEHRHRGDWTCHGKPGLSEQETPSNEAVGYWMPLVDDRKRCASPSYLTGGA